MLDLIKSIPQRVAKTIKKEWKNPYFRVFLLLMIVGIFLRFYQIYGFVTFLGDQGRDAIVLRRIVTLEHLPAIGAPSSVGMVFLGPFYYYLVAPWLLLFGFNPVGPAVGVAVIATLSIFFGYFAVKDLFNEKIAVMTMIFFMFHNVLVNLSRFSWNPNLLPYFALFTIYFFVKALQTKRLLYFVLTGAFISMSMQMHYVFLALTVPTGLWTLFYLYKNRKEVKSSAINLGGMIGAFLFIASPLILFDIKNKFLNASNFINVFTGGEGSSQFSLDEILTTYVALNEHVFMFNTSQLVASVFLIAIVGLMIYSLRKKGPLAIITSTFVIGIIITSFFTENKFPHYYGAIYPLYFLILGYALMTLFWKGKLKFIVSLFLVYFVAVQAPTFSFIYGKPNYQVPRAMKIARVVQENVTEDVYQVASLPNKYNDHTYRYFLEVWGNRPLEKDTLEKADELFVICEQECKPIGDAQWDIAYFAPTEVVGTWELEGVTIYKLVR